MTTKPAQPAKDATPESDQAKLKLDRRLWPLPPQYGMIWVILLLMTLLLGIANLRTYFQWPSDSSENAVLIGILVLSLLPIVLPLLDTIIERGGVIGFGDMKLDFSQGQPIGIPSIPIPVNIGVRGTLVLDLVTTPILETLREASTCSLAIIDLEEGQAWWETRLLVLLAGAVRLKKPDKIVFVGTSAGKQYCFQGWASTEDLFPRLVRAHPQYLRSLQRATAAASQWELLGPNNPINPGNPGLIPPPQPTWVQPGLATDYLGKVFDNTTGLLNEFLIELLLAADLSEQIEKKGSPKSISLARLDDLFPKELHKESIDRSLPVEQQLDAFFQSDAPYIAVTRDGVFMEIVSRLAVLNRMLKPIIEQMSGK